MGDYTQADRAFRVDTPLGEDELLLEAFTGQEPISAPFRCTLELLSENDAIAPADILEQPVCISVRLADDSERCFHGIVSRFVQLGKSEELTSYEAEVVPWLWFLSLSRDCKVFQQKSVIEIVEEVFAEYPNADYTNNCIQTYPPREYCVQYRESDLNFVSRLLEEEGIYYYFEHTSEGHKLTLVDDTSVVEPCPVQSTYQVATTPEAWLEEDVIVEIQWEHVVNTGKVTLRDYDYLQPGNNLEASRGGDGGEVYDYPGLYTEVSEGERFAATRLEEERVDQQTVRGSSTCRTLATGHSFDLTRYYIDAANQTYLVVGAWHTARGGGYRSGAPDTTYRNQFECVPTSIPYRPPRRARKPLVQGSQSAVVTGPSDEEIYTDEHGRVKIQFHWDRLGQKDENSSCWVRVSHPWAGKGWGQVWIPRIGQEVIVDFLEANPDCPIITGRVYNQDMTPPYDLPANKTQSGIKSRSTKDGSPSNFNEIRFEDKKGEEQFFMHAEKDMQTVVKQSRSASVGAGDSVNVGGDRSLTVKGAQTNTIEKSITTKAASLALGTGGDPPETAAGGVGIKAGGDYELAAANIKQNAGTALDAGAPTVTVAGKQKVAITSDTEITLGVGGNSIKIDPGGVTIVGVLVKIN